MVDHPNIPKVDIADEAYNGPSATIAALGRGVVQHLAWAGYGLAGAGTLAYLAPKTAAAILTNSRAFAARLKESNAEGFIAGTQRATGKFIHSIFGLGEGGIGSTSIAPEYREWLDHSIIHKEHGFGHWLISHTFGLLPYFGKKICGWLDDAGKVTASERYKRITNAITFGGTFGAAGYISGWLEAFGSRHGNDGSMQLQTVQQALKKEYTTNDALAAQNTKLAEENAALKTQHSAPRAAGPAAKDAASRRDPIKAPEQDWASEMAAQRETATAEVSL